LEISLSAGSANSFASSRTMKSGTNILRYNLYTDIGRTSVWGNGTAGTQLPSFTDSGITTSRTINVYGRAVYSTLPTPATDYGDLITVAVTY
jgi:spore coat protein U-like protein